MWCVLKILEHSALLYSLGYYYTLMTHVLPSQIEKIESLKEEAKYDEAMQLVNRILVKDPTNEDALLQVADIQYRQGDITKAEKAVDFYNSRKKNKDPMGLYIKWVLEMEKNEWIEAKKVLKMALELTDFNNHEILRCYGLAEYWYWNREKGVKYIENAFEINNMDAEVIYNLIELYLLERNFRKAEHMIKYYFEKHEHIKAFDKDISFYDNKIDLFQKFLKNYLMLKSK